MIEMVRYVSVAKESASQDWSLRDTAMLPMTCLGRTSTSQLKAGMIYAMCRNTIIDQTG